jgi:hypothetical protein
MSRGLVALLLVATLVVSGCSSALVSWAVTSAVVGAQTPTAGVDGEDGTDGTDGTDGVDGTDGIDGVDGSAGAPGARGSRGPTGATGAEGTQGLQGADGADAVLASAEMTVPDGPVSFTGGQLVIGTPLNIESAPIVVISWRITLQAEHTPAYVVCQIRDSATSASYASFGNSVYVDSPGILTAATVVNLSDTVLELVCSDLNGTAQQWVVSGASASALTLET